MHLPLPLARQFWTALAAAHWSAAVAVRQAFALARGVKDGLAAPPRVVEAIEALVGERHLTRREANRLEEAIFRSIDSTGHWLSRGQREARTDQH